MKTMTPRGPDGRFDSFNDRLAESRGKGQTEGLIAALVVAATAVVAKAAIPAVKTGVRKIKNRFKYGVWY